MAKIEWKDAQKSVLDDSGNMLVSASAGTGKTTVMLEKVIRLWIRSQYRPFSYHHFFQSQRR